MPYKIEYLEEVGGIITTYWGVVSDDDIQQSGQEKHSKLDMLKSYRYALTDLSRVEKFNVSSASIRENALSSSNILDKYRQIVVVFVLPTKAIYGMGRMWQAYAGDNADRSFIFDSRIEADKWLNEFLDRDKHRQ